jgi:hypothetical protein
MAAPRATYVYCVVKNAKGAKALSLARAPKGLAGAEPPRLLDAGDGYRVVVASAPLAKYAAGKINARLEDIEWVAERGTEHEALVEHVAEQVAAKCAVVPMKMFTLFSNDERALAHVVKMRKMLDRVADRIAGCEEWGLRILFDEAEATRIAAEEARASKASSGTTFLERKKKQQDVRRAMNASAADEVEGLYDALGKIAKRSVRRAAPNRELAGRVLLDAVFLVAKKESKRFQKTVGATAERLAQRGFHVALTGPWPAYSFIGAK